MKTKSPSIRVSFIMLAFAGCLVLGMTDGLAQLDYGDAPDSPYPTFFASDGARHATVGPLLGTERDSEGNGQPTTGADGDDLAGVPDDEDGVTFTSVLVPGALATVDVETSGTGPYILNAWVDFNNDGDWNDPGEQIFTDTVLVFGINAGLTFPVPPGAKLGKRTYSRWRIDDGTWAVRPLKPDGGVDNGEVEDYCHGSVHGQKWWDKNGDGKKDPDEPGLNGWVIEFWDAKDPLNPGDDVLATTIKTQDKEVDGKKGINRFTERGLFWVGGVPQGFYIIREQLYANSVQTYPANCGSDHYFVKVNECQVLGRVPPDQPPVCGNQIDWVDGCQQGKDGPFTTGALQVGTPAGAPFFGQPLDLFVSGDTVIERSQGVPGQPGHFDTEIVEMDLTGSHPQLGPIHVRAGADFGLPPSNGTVTEVEPPPPTDPFLAESFFDVFFEIEIPGQALTLHNQNGALVEAVPGITEVPPIGVDYIELGPIPLLDPGNNPSGFTVIQMTHKPRYGLDFGNHQINVRPDCCIGKKSRIGTHKFNNVYLPNRQLLRCRGKVRRPLMWFVTIENDGDVPDVICAKSTRFNRTVKFKCVERGRGNVTSALLKGTYTTQLDPGEVRLIKCTTTAKNRRAKRLTVRNTIKATSKTDPTKIDAVRLLAKLRR